MTHYKVLSCLPVRPVSMESDEIRLNTLAGAVKKYVFFYGYQATQKKYTMCYYVIDTQRVHSYNLHMVNGDQ